MVTRVSRVFSELIEAKWDERKYVCVGLDTDLTNPKFPEVARKDSDEETVVYFNSAHVDATCDLVCAYKPNIAFYEGLGPPGISALMRTVAYINERAPEVPVIGDLKRADIGNTNLGYVRAAFEVLGFDAMTVHPYLGGEALQPFLARKEKGIIVLCRTSNPGAGEFQDLHTLTFDPRQRPADVSVEEWLAKIYQDTMPLYQRDAHSVVNWNKNGNVGVVVGATYPEELREVRQIVGDMFILIPAIGAQGGEVEPAVKYGMTKKKRGTAYNSARAIIFASSGPDFAEVGRQKTLELHQMINQYR